MALVDELKAEVSGITKQTWDTRDGNVVPDTSTVKLAGGAVRLRATFLYADLARSTDLAMRFDPRIAAKIARAFLATCTRIICALNGDIRSFDGDRVMGIFVGETKNTSAARAALHIHYAFRELIRPQFEAKYPALKDFGLSYGVGVDTSDVFAVRAGIRNNNDLVWIGRAPNIAAKLSNVRVAPYHTIITADVYELLADVARFGGRERENMWTMKTWDGGVSTVYVSAWYWKP